MSDPDGEADDDGIRARRDRQSRSRERWKCRQESSASRDQVEADLCQRDRMGELLPSAGSMPG